MISRLTQVEHVEGDLDADGGPFVARQRFVVTRGLMRFVAEVLDGFVIEQTVQRLAGGIVVALIQRAAIAAAPPGQRAGEADIDQHREKRDDGIAPTEHAPDDRGDQQQFHRRGDHVEHGEAQHRLHARHASVDDARQPAGLPVEVKPQADPVQMLIGLQGHHPHRALRDRGEQGVPDFAEPRRADRARCHSRGSAAPATPRRGCPVWSARRWFSRRGWARRPPPLWPGP